MGARCMKYADFVVAIIAGLVSGSIVSIASAIILNNLNIRNLIQQEKLLLLHELYSIEYIMSNYLCSFSMDIRAENYNEIKNRVRLFSASYRLDTSHKCLSDEFHSAYNDTKYFIMRLNNYLNNDSNTYDILIEKHDFIREKHRKLWELTERIRCVEPVEKYRFIKI